MSVLISVTCPLLLCTYNVSESETGRKVTKELKSHDCNIFDQDKFLSYEMLSKSWCLTKVCAWEVERLFISLSTLTVCGG